MNKINFKIREGDENNIKDLEEKIKMVEIDLNKNKYKVSIKKENIKKKKTIQNNEEKGLNINNEMQNKAYKKKSLLSQLPAVDFKYKNNYKKLFNRKKDNLEGGIGYYFSRIKLEEEKSK